jgi:hypothetical protein
MNIKNIMLMLSLIFTTMVTGEDNRMLLSDVKSLTLHANNLTTGNRAAPIQQLTCLGRFCDKSPSMVECTNVGLGTAVDLRLGLVPHWECKAVMDKSIKFAYINVQCEGYDSPYDNKYIYAGSCGLKYRLEPINKIIHKDGEHEGNSFLGLLTIISLICCIMTMCASSSEREGFGEGMVCGLFLALLCGNEDDDDDDWGWSSDVYTCSGFGDTSFR